MQQGIRFVRIGFITQLMRHFAAMKFTRLILIDLSRYTKIFLANSTKRDLSVIALTGVFYKTFPINKALVVLNSTNQFTSSFKEFMPFCYKLYFFSSKKEF
jgi:hypothetical protein